MARLDKKFIRYMTGVMVLNALSLFLCHIHLYPVILCTFIWSNGLLVFQCKRPVLINLSLMLIFISTAQTLYFMCRDYREWNFIVMDTMLISTVLPLQILANGRFPRHFICELMKLSKYVSIKRAFLKMVVLHTCNLLVVAICIYCFCYGIYCAANWADNYPLGTIDNYVFGYGNVDGNIQEKQAEIANHDIAQTNKRFLVDKRQTTVLNNVPVYHEQLKTLPLQARLIERYLGEGAKLSCKFQVTLATDLLPLYSVSTFFSKNDTDIRDSFRHRISRSEKVMQSATIHHLYLEMTYFDIEDFGVYRAGLRIIKRSGKRISVYSESTYEYVDIKEEYACAFNVSRINEYYKYIDAPVGGLLFFKYFFSRGVARGDVLRVEHFVNGVPITTLSDITLRCCLPSVYYLFITWNQLSLQVPSLVLNIDPKSSSENADIFMTSAIVCVCSSMYGVHKFKFYRDWYDSVHNAWTLYEFWHPQITIVYPTSSNVLWNTISNTESILIEKSKKEVDFDIFNGSSFQYLQNTRDLEYFTTTLFEYSSFILILSTITALSILYWIYTIKLMNRTQEYAFFKMGIIFKINLPDIGGNLANLRNVEEAHALAVEHNLHDVLVSYVEEDRYFVLRELDSFLNANNLSVLLEDNLPSGPKLDNLYSAVRYSRKVIVVVSENYVNDNFNNNFFLPNILLPMLYDGHIASGHLMLLVCKPCRIPPLLFRDRKIVILDYTRNPKEIFFRKLYDWLNSSLVQEDFSMQPVFHTDLVRFN